MSDSLEKVIGYLDEVIRGEHGSMPLHNSIQRVRDRLAAIRPDAGPGDYQDIAEFLRSIGWRAPCDAQWTRLRDSLPTLREMLGVSLRQVPEGYVVVPRYPTHDMERAGAEYAQSYGASLNCVAMSVYASMIAAALKANPVPPTSVSMTTCGHSKYAPCHNCEPTAAQALGDVLPCPFCGSSGFRSEYDDHGGRDVYTVTCSNDDCPVSELVAFGDTREDADSRWNQRQHGQHFAGLEAEVELVRSGLRSRGEYIEGQPPLPLALVAYDHMRKRAEAAEARCAELEAEVEQARETLAKSLDADGMNEEQLRTLAMRASNALYWRTQTTQVAEARAIDAEARVREAEEMASLIINLSDSTMKDGDAARELCAAFLAARG